MHEPLSARSARFCAHCGEELPPGQPRFCIACGKMVDGAPPAAETPLVAPAALGQTVRLANANVAQAVVGGTVRLATSGAAPSGLWFAPEPPGASDVVAVYAPLRAIVGGWSGLAGQGWRKVAEQASTATGETIVTFEVEREWFPARGCGNDLRLRVVIRAESYAEHGRTRQGFRYRVGDDTPMRVTDVWWLDAQRHPRRDLPMPDIQIMAPPRVPRVSDYTESIRQLTGAEAEPWARAGAVHGFYRMPNPNQQHTTAGRGLLLDEITGGWMVAQFLARRETIYRVQMRRPLVCDEAAWQEMQPQIQAEARGVGIDMETAPVVEWWFDRQGHDGLLLETPVGLGFVQRRAIAFRRAQVAAIRR